MCSLSLFWNNRHALGRSQVPVAPYAIHAHPRMAGSHTPEHPGAPVRAHSVPGSPSFAPARSRGGSVPSPREAEESSSVADVRTRADA